MPNQALELGLGGKILTCAKIASQHNSANLGVLLFGIVGVLTLRSRSSLVYLP